MKFTERFNELIKISGKTQVQIAKEINVSKQCVSDYKSGKSLPTLETLYLTALPDCLHTSKVSAARPIISPTSPHRAERIM